MSLFVIGDTHLSFGSSKPMDVFEGWSGFEEKLELGWRSCIGEEDTVVIAGDFSWAMSLEEAAVDFRFLHALPGRKLLVKGNHDYWWTTVSKMDAFIASNGFSGISFVNNNAYAAGPVAVCGTRGWLMEENTPQDTKMIRREAGRLRASVLAAKQTGGEPVAFLHYPPVGPSGACEPILSVLEDEGVARCFYGHLHSASAARAVTGLYRGIRFSLISSDYLGFCPALVETY